MSLFCRGPTTGIAPSTGKNQEAIGHTRWDYTDVVRNYNCSPEDDDDMLTFADGVNNLQSVDWETDIHAFQCSIENEGYLDK